MPIIEPPYVFENFLIIPITLPVTFNFDSFICCMIGDAMSCDYSDSIGSSSESILSIAGPIDL